MAAKTFGAMVKMVLSGDTLVLTSPNNPSLERTFSLAYVSAPRMSKDNEEPFAFASREALRQLAVGKGVQCNILYTIPNSGRDYGTARLGDGTELPDSLVRDGWVRVREDAGKKEDTDDVLERIERLKGLEAQARAEAKGLHAGNGGVVEVQNDLGSPDFLKEWKGRTCDGVVERVITGDRLLVRVKLSDTKHLQTMTLVAGIRTPATERTANGATQPAEEYGNEAKAFVEQRLLQRAVKVKMVGASSNGQLIASIMHPRGRIAVFLLSEGLARCNDFHSTMLGADMAELRAAEKEAQSKALRLFKNFVAKSSDNRDVEMIVTKVIGADAIVVRPSKTGIEKRISLSSVRGPRAGEPSEAPFRDEAKEYARKRLIGKHVRVSVDGSKAATDDFEARDVATVTQNGKNIGLALVQEGYCTVIRHRKDDTDRAPNYDELLAAQEQAKEAKKGIWSGKPPKIRTYTDMSESVQKAKIQVSTLSRQRRVPGIVDFCKSGSRFTILIPREGGKLTLVLAGISTPRAPGRNAQDKGEPFGAEALELANRRCNQRDCEMDVYSIDKAGGFIGDLYVNRESFARVLVEEGLAKVHEYSAERLGNAAELLAAQQKAKEGRKGMWKDWDPSQDAGEDEDLADHTAAAANGAADAAPAAERKPVYKDIVITSIDDNKLKIQEIGPGTASLTTLMSEFRKFHLDPKNGAPLADSPKAGDFVAAKFSVDGDWYRARIRANDRTAKVAEVVYIDYGNAEKQPWAALRPLDQQRFGTQRLRPQAHEVQLSLVQLPVTSPDYLRDAVDFLYEATDGKQLVGSFDHVESPSSGGGGGTTYVTLYDPHAEGGARTAADSLNRALVRAGHAMVARKLRPWERTKPFEPVLRSLMEAEAQAKSERLGMWEYGDLTED